MPKSCKLLSNKKVIRSVIDMFRDGSVLTAKDVSGMSNDPCLGLSESRVNRILIMLFKQGILKRDFHVEYLNYKDIRFYEYSLMNRSVLFDLEV